MRKTTSPKPLCSPCADGPTWASPALTNALVGEKIAIVSNKPQTTRNRIYGVVNRGDTQFVLLDTPGLHKARTRLGDYMVKVVRESLAGVEAALLLVEPIAPRGRAGGRHSPAHPGGEAALRTVHQQDRHRGAQGRVCWRSSPHTARSTRISTPSSPSPPRTGDGLEDLLAQMQRYAVEGPQLFPDGMTTDQPDQQVCAEIIREKMLLCLDKEIPHGTAVEVTRFTEREDSGIIDLDVTIYCEKASHKGIIIGKHGDMLKRISTLARQDIEKFMGTKVYLETWVKVKENWRDNVNFIRSQGYNEQ